MFIQCMYIYMYILTVDCSYKCLLISYIEHEESVPKKRDTIVGYLREKSEMEMSVKREELEMRREELKLEKVRFELDREERRMRMETEKLEKTTMLEILKKCMQNK